MAKALALPEGFEYEDAPVDTKPTSSSLPEGFEWEDMSDEMVSPELEADVARSEKPKEELGPLDKAADWYVEEKSKPNSSFKDYMSTFGKGVKDFFLSDKQDTYGALAADENNPEREEMLQRKLETIDERQNIREEASKVPFGGLVSGIGQSAPLLPVAFNPVSRGTSVEGFATKTAINTGVGAEIGYRSGITEEEKKEGAVVGAAGGALLPAAVGGIERGVGALLPKKTVTSIDRSTPPTLDSTVSLKDLEEVSAGLRSPKNTDVLPQEGLGLFNAVVNQDKEQVVEAIKKANASGMSPERIKEELVSAAKNKNLDENYFASEVDKVLGKVGEGNRSDELARLQNEINEVAKDTSLPGAKEKLAQLQKDKAYLEQSAFTPVKPTKQDTLENIEAATQQALESGNTLPEAQEAVIRGLQKSNQHTPEEIDEIVEAALLPFKEGNPITAPLPTLTPKQAAQASSAASKSVRSKKDKYVNEQEMDAALKGRGMKLSLNYNNDLAPFYSISRIFSKKNGNKFGSGDNITGDKHLALIKNSRFQHDNAIIPNLIGPEDGSANFIVKMTKDGVTEDDFTVKPLMTIQKEARDAGLAPEQLDEFRLAANALDDYTNIERDIAQVNTRISDLKTALSKETDATKKVEIKSSLKDAQKELKDLSSTETYTRYKDRDGNFVALPRQKVDQIIKDLQNNPAGKQYLDDLQKWSQHLIDIRVEAGLLSKAEADALKKSHPYYLSAKREIDDYGFDDLKVFTSTGSANKGVKSRGISSTDYNASPVENTVANMQGAVRAAQRNKERQLMMDFFIEKLDPNAWNKIFREDMQDVMYAIQRAKFDPDAPKVIEASKITKADPLQKTGNFQLYYNGKRIDLTIVDQSMLKSMTRPSTYVKDSGHPGLQLARNGIINLAQAKRNLITTYNPVFNVQSLVRESFGYALSADQRIVGRGNLYKFWKSYSVLNDFRKDPTFYKKLKENVSPGVLARDYQNVKGESLVKDVAESKLFYDERGIANKAKKSITNNKVVTSLAELAQYSDMATRGRYYKDVKAAMLKQGKSPEEAESMAMAAARDLAVNYQERGAAEWFNNYKSMVPFLKTTINSMTKDMSALRYKKQQVAEVLTAMTGMSYGLLQYNEQFVDEKGVSTYYQIPHHVRLNNWVMKTGNDVNDYVIIPAPFSFVGKLPLVNAEGLDMAFTSMANTIAEGHAKGTKEVVKNVPSGKLTPQDLVALNVNLLAGQFNPSSFLPVGMSTTMEIGANRDWKGAPIEPDFLSKVEAPDRFIPGQTSKLAIELGKQLGESPIQIQYAIEANTAALGKAVMSGGDMLISAIEGKEKPRLEPSSLPFVDRFSGYGSEADKTNAGQMYSRISKELRTASDTLNKRKKDYTEGSGSKEDYLEYAEENRELVRAYKTIIEPSNKKITDLYKKILRLQYGGYESDRTKDKEVLGDPKLREKIDDLKDQITATREKALQQIERNKEKYGDLWERRLQTTPQTDLLMAPFRSNKPENKDKTLDKQSSIWDNFSLISSAQAAETQPNPREGIPEGVSTSMAEDTTRGVPGMLDLPPGYVYEQPAELKAEMGKFNEENGFFEMMLPKTTKEVKKRLEPTKIESKSSSLSPNYFKNLAMAESSNNPNAKAATSSAVGKYQFLKGTWADLVKKYGKTHGLTEKGITSEKQQDKAIKLFTLDNKKQLAAKLDIPLARIDDTAAYSAHFLGVNGAAKLLTAPYSAPAAKLLPDAAQANKSIFFNDKGKPRTVKEVLNTIENKINGNV